MALVNMRDLVYHAYDNNYAVGAFDHVLRAVMLDTRYFCHSRVTLPEGARR